MGKSNKLKKEQVNSLITRTSLTIVIIVAFFAIIFIAIFAMIVLGVPSKSYIGNSVPCTAINTEGSKDKDLRFTGFVDDKDSNHCILYGADGKTILYGGKIDSNK